MAFSAEERVERARDARRRWKERHAAKYRAAESERYLRSYKFKRASKAFGLTREEYDAMFEKQRGLCAICGRPERRILHGKPTTLSIDHDHVTNRVRGLLCSTCNHGIAKFDDNPEWLMRAAAYVTPVSETPGPQR